LRISQEFSGLDVDRSARFSLSLELVLKFRSCKIFISSLLRNETAFKFQMVSGLTGIFFNYFSGGEDAGDYSI
jgi:hypothetical protein